MTTPIRFGTVGAYRQGIAGNWTFTVNGQEDIQANQKLIDKYGYRLANEPNPAFELHITAQPYPGRYGLNPSKPLITKISDKEPAQDELVLISNLLDKADADSTLPTPTDGTHSRFSDLREGLFTVALKQLKQQAGSPQAALAKLAGLFEKPFEQISRCCK